MDDLITVHSEVEKLLALRQKRKDVKQQADARRAKRVRGGRVLMYRPGG